MCFNGHNYDLSIQYSAKLLKYKPDLARHCISKAKNEIEKNIIIRRISLNRREYFFLDAYKQAILLEKYNLWLLIGQIAAVSIGLIGFILLGTVKTVTNWFVNVPFWLPLPLIIISFQIGDWSGKSKSLMNINFIGIFIAVITSVITAMIETIRQYKLKNRIWRIYAVLELPPSLLAFYICTIFNIWGSFFIIRPNLASITNIAFVEITVYILPIAVCVIMYLMYFEKWNAYDSELVAVWLNIYIIWIFFLEGKNQLNLFINRIANWMVGH
jgi:hypothetical protein